MKKLAAAAAVCAAGLVLRLCARLLDGFSDYYAVTMNAFWVNTLGRLSGLFPFSLAEMLIYFLAALFIFRIVCLLVKAAGKKPGVKKHFLDGLFTILLLAAIVFFLFEANEDVYFYRTTFAERYGYGTGSYSTAELEQVCTYLMKEANKSAGSVERDPNGIMKDSAGVGERVRKAMMNLGKTYPELSGWYPEAKGLMASFAMSRTGMAGIYSAYTIEANYNRDMPEYNIAFTMSHELSHLKGVLPENEANFIAYLNCMESSDSDIRYSGVLTGWIYCGNELLKRDRTAWEGIASQMKTDINADLNYNTEFWNSYKGTVQEAAQNFNDSYLKGEGQDEGVLSYDRVVDLIVSYEMQKLPTV